MSIINRIFVLFSINYFEKNIFKTLYIWVKNSFSKKGILKLYGYDLKYWEEMMTLENSTYHDVFLYRQTKITMEKYKNEK